MPSARTAQVSQGNRLDNIFEAVSVVTGQSFAFAAAAQLLTVRPLEVNVPFLLRAGATGL